MSDAFPHLVKVTLLAISLAAPARPESLRNEGPDDPFGRLQARIAVEGRHRPEAMLKLLHIARQEAARWGVRNVGLALAPAAVAGHSWVNVGPAGADFTQGGAKVDSGRPNTVLVDPRDANVVYVATSGGGVWKTFNALADYNAGAAVTWLPITESIGSLAAGAIALNPQSPDSLLLGLGDFQDVQVPGVLHSDDGGATWLGDSTGAPVVLSGTYPGNGTWIASSTEDIQFGATGATVLAATNAGLFRSTTAGVDTNWTLIDLSATHTPQYAWSLGYVGGQTWLLTTQDLPDSYGPNGRLWRSIDDGASWSEVTSALGTSASDVRRMTLAAAPSDRADPGHARVYLLAQNGAYPGDQKDVFRSNDGGQTWSSLGMYTGSGLTPTNPTCNTDPTLTNNRHQPDLNVMHGQAFYNHMIVVDPKNHDTVFVGGNLASLRSLDGGAHWSVIADWLPAIGSFTCTGTGTRPSLPAAMYVHADYHAQAIAYAGSTGYLFMGTDGGIFRSANALTVANPGQVVWEDRINRGIVSHLIFSSRTGSELPSSAQCTTTGGSDLIIGGLQDNGTRLRALTATPANSDPTIFDDVTGGDGFGTGIGCNAPTSTTVGSLLIATYVSTVYRSTDGGQNFFYATNGFLSPLDRYYTFNMKIAPDFTDPTGRSFLTVLTSPYAAYTDCPTGSPQCYEGYVYATSNGALNWSNAMGTVHSAAGGTRANMPYPAINVSASKTAHLWGAVSLYSAYVTTNGGTDWYESKLSFSPVGPNYWAVPFHTIEVDPSDATGNTVWVGSASTADGGGVAIPAVMGHLYKCSDLITGTHCATWTSMGTSTTTGLPNVPIKVIRFDPNDANTIYVGTWLGIYRSQDHGATWARYGQGLPLVEVNDIAISADGSAIRIGTYGRGFWEIYPKAGGSLHGVYGSGDFDSNQVIDGYDLVRLAAALLTDSSSADYQAVANLVGTRNAIDEADLSQLLSKFGGRP